MSYATISQTIFQGIGGFAVAQLLLPRSLFDQKYALQLQQQKLQEQELHNERPLEQNVRKLVSKIQSLSAAPPVYRTVSQDISVLSEEYRGVWTAGVTAVIVCGGPMAILGAGAAVAFLGDDGAKRYIKAKQWFETATASSHKEAAK